MFSNLFSASYWIQLLMMLPAILIALSLHELAHGWVSYKLGDPTPKMQGRLTLNPKAHLDLIGTICMILVHFGWAKPVQIDTRYYKHPKRGIILVSLAGVTMNFVLAFLSAIILIIMKKYLHPFSYNLALLCQIAENMVDYGILMNIMLGLFNLIPIPPLDGSKVLFAILPYRFYNFILKYEQYGMFILLVLMVTNVFSIILSPGINFLYNNFLALANLII